MRELRRVFALTGTPDLSEAREYFDTFDWRLFRAGLALSRSGHRLALSDIFTNEQTAQGAWRRKSPPRFAHDLPSDDLRRFVAGVSDPRALLPVAQVRVEARIVELHGEDGAPVGVVRFETASVARARRTRRLMAAIADVPEDDAPVARALARAGFRASDQSWPETLLREAGCRPGDFAPRPAVAAAEDTPARTALAAILQHLHHTMRRNEDGIRRDIDVEFLHDYRVALRRTRAALGELRGVLPADAESQFRERLRALGGPTGEVRDLDVHLARRDAYLARLPESFRPGLDAVFHDVQARRDHALDTLRALLASREYATLMRDWKRALAALASGERVGIDAEASALDLARRAIRRRYDRLSGIAAAPESLDPAALHRARLNGKKLRYMIEFFQDALGRRAAGSLARIESLQDALGEYNDLGVQARFFQGMLQSLPDGRAAAYPRAAALGGIIALVEARRRKVRRRCERRLQSLRDPLPPAGA